MNAISFFYQIRKRMPDKDLLKLKEMIDKEIERRKENDIRNNVKLE